MSVKVNDVRATSADVRYQGVAFSGSIRNAIKQAKAAPDYGLPDADIRAPKETGRDRAALLGFLRLLPDNPLAAAHGAPFSVISAELPTCAPAWNVARTAHLKSLLLANGSRFVSVTGSYKGEIENSFAVLTPTVVDRLTVDGFAELMGQESVLHVDAQRNAVLWFIASGKSETVGRWGPVESIVGIDAWTRDSSGQHYAVKSQHSFYSVAYAQERGWLTPDVAVAMELDPSN